MGGAVPVRSELLTGWLLLFAAAAVVLAVAAGVVRWRQRYADRRPSVAPPTTDPVRAAATRHTAEVAARAAEAVARADRLRTEAEHAARVCRSARRERARVDRVLAAHRRPQLAGSDHPQQADRVAQLEAARERARQREAEAVRGWQEARRWAAVARREAAALVQETAESAREADMTR